MVFFTLSIQNTFEKDLGSRCDAELLQAREPTQANKTEERKKKVHRVG